MHGHYVNRIRRNARNYDNRCSYVQIDRDYGWLVTKIYTYTYIYFLSSMFRGTLIFLHVFQPIVIYVTFDFVIGFYIRT